MDGSDSALYFWWDWVSGVSGYRAVLSIPATDDSAPYVLESKDITEKSGESGDEYGETFFIALENDREYLLTVMPLGSEGASFATLAASALAAPKIEQESPNVLLFLYLDENGDLSKVSEGLSAIRTENGFLTVDAVAFQGTSDGNAHLVGFDDDDDGSPVDISYTWERIERVQDSDGSYYIEGVDFENGAFFGNLLSCAHERFTQTKLVAYIEASVDTATLAAAIQSANLGLVGGKKPFDVIVFDGKNDSSLESLWPLASSADYIAASPDDAGSVDVTKLIKSFKTDATAESIAKEVATNYAKDNEHSEADWTAVEEKWSAELLPNQFTSTLTADEREAALNFYALTAVPSFTVVNGAKLNDLTKAWDELAKAVSEAGDKADFVIANEEDDEEVDFLEAVM